MKKITLSYIFLLILGCQEKDLSRKAIDGKLEPPAPSEEENERTLLGVDANQNGVRDDVERWINRKFPEDYNLRMLYKQEAKEMSLLLHQYKDLSFKDIRKYFDDTGRAGACGLYVYGTLRNDRSAMIKMGKVSDELEKLVYNTRKRRNHFDEFESKFNGLRGGMPPLNKMHEYCDFKVRQ